MIEIIFNIVIIIVIIILFIFLCLGSAAAGREHARQKIRFYELLLEEIRRNNSSNKDD